MRISLLFTKTSRETPSNEVALNAQLLIRAGFIHKEMAGVYAYTYLGLKVVENIKKIVREEMNTIGGQEIIMTNLQPKEVWEKTTRWDDKVVDIWFKTKLQDGNEIGLAWSHEEPILEMIKDYVSSYKDLPVHIYQFQNKLRNELRSKSGIMRGREFLMKDSYSISTDKNQHDKIYDETTKAYIKIFDRFGIGEDTYVTFASGGAFTKFSHEFQTICEAGEDIIYLHKEKNIAVNEEVLTEENLKELGIKKEELVKVKSAEVGNIFNFGTDKAKQMDVGFTDKDGNKQFVHLGSYGIGITRVMGVIVEKMSDEKGLVWPEDIAPAKVYIVRIGENDEVVKIADNLYKTLLDKDIDVLYDDRDARAGEKFADADLMGIPYRIVISDKTVESGKHEFKKRTNSDIEMLDIDGILKVLVA